jgi:hypothetical protein
VPDLFVLHRGIAHMVEIKTDDGVLSDAQRSVATAVLAAGGHVVSRDADEALACLGRFRTRRHLVCVQNCTASGDERTNTGLDGLRGQGERGMEQPTPEPILKTALGFMAAKFLFVAEELGLCEPRPA